MRSAIIILSGWRFLSAFLRKKSPLGVFSRADPELSSYPFWLKLKTLSHPMWGYLSEYFRYLLSFSDSFLKTAYVAVWTLLAGCVIWVMGTFSLFSKMATWSGVGIRRPGGAGSERVVGAGGDRRECGMTLGIY